MDRISDDLLSVMIECEEEHLKRKPSSVELCFLMALTELRDRRAAEKALDEWDTYEMGRDGSSAAPFWCQFYKDGTLYGQGIGMTMGDAIRQAVEKRGQRFRLTPGGGACILLVSDGERSFLWQQPMTIHLARHDRLSKAP